MESASRQAASSIEPKLLTRVAKGDPQAFSQLYDQSSTLLFTLAYRILSDREEASELLQEVYLEVWRKIAKYDVGRGSPIAWLVTLTRSRAIDWLRSRASRGLQLLAGSLEHPLVSTTPDVSQNPYESREDSELRQMMAKAILDLPLPQQQAIEMAYYQGLTHTEIAAKLNQPLGTVKTRLKLAMTKLRASLHQTLPQGEGS
jgi:RNA polymerase sigma-70 factor (ECF subfamily)